MNAGLGVLERLRVRYGRPKTPAAPTILKTRAKMYLEYEGHPAIEMGLPTSIEFETKKILIKWHKPFPHLGRVLKYVIWTELIGFREMDFDYEVQPREWIEITYTLHATHTNP